MPLHSDCVVLKYSSVLTFYGYKTFFFSHFPSGNEYCSQFFALLINFLELSMYNCRFIKFEVKVYEIKFCIISKLSCDFNICFSFLQAPLKNPAVHFLIISSLIVCLCNCFFPLFFLMSRVIAVLSSDSTEGSDSMAYCFHWLSVSMTFLSEVFDDLCEFVPS